MALIIIRSTVLGARIIYIFIIRQNAKKLAKKKYRK